MQRVTLCLSSAALVLLARLANLTQLRKLEAGPPNVTGTGLAPSPRCPTSRSST